MKTKLQAKNILPLLAEKFGMEFTPEQKSSDVEVVRTVAQLVPDKDGTALIRCTTDDVDRDGEVVLPEGIETKAFEKNGVLCWSHNYTIPAVGTTEAMQFDAHTMHIKGRFGQTQFAKDICSLVKDRIVKAVSVGFLPIEKIIKGQKGFSELVAKRLAHLTQEARESVNSIVTKCLLVEVSFCNIGCNQEALILAAKSFDSEGKKALGIAEHGAVTIGVVKAEAGDGITKKGPLVDSILVSLKEALRSELVAENPISRIETAAGGNPGNPQNPDMTQTPGSGGVISTAAVRSETVEAKGKQQMEIIEGIEIKGDYPGHEFHGNQYVGASGSGKENEASRSAHQASKDAHDKASHQHAANAHASAAKLHEAQGHTDVAAYHEAMSHYHQVSASHRRKYLDLDALESKGIRVLAASEDEYRKVLAGKVIA